MSHERRVPRIAGLSLIELLVALVIAALLIAGAVTVYVQSRGTFRASEAASRLQENARYALSFVETDLRMANFWGLNSRPDYIINRAGSPQALSGEAWMDECAANWPIDLENFVVATNGTEAFDCIDDTDFVAGTDVLTVRRSAREAEVTELEDKRLYIQTSRIQGTMFVADGCNDPDDVSCLPPGFLPPQSESHAVLVHSYYISPDSVGRAGVPSLRRVRLIAGPAAESEEIIPGVEDLQVEMGVDSDEDTTADYYVLPDAVPAGSKIVSVRVWLRIRADEPDFTFVDGRTYSYAGVNYTPGTGGDANRYRRFLVSKTIQLRNTRV
jgi:type II secretory pathway pseudopilin PulG